MQRAKVNNFLKKNCFIFLILVGAAFLRFYRLPELTTFAGDQGIDLLVVKRMIVDHDWTLLGPKTSILSIYNGPVYYYLILPVLFLSKLNPVSVSCFMVFLWLGAIFLTYFLTKEVFNERAGLIAAFLFSIWPPAIEFSRPSFNSFPTPFFAALFLFGIYKYLKNRHWGLVLAGFCAGILLQLHYFNFFLIALTFTLFLIKKRFSFKFFFIFVVSFCLTFSPMIFFELRHDFFNSRTLLKTLSERGMSDFTWQLHYFIAFFPLLFIFLGGLFNYLVKRNKLMGVVLFSLLSFLFLRGVDLKRDHGFTMPEGWNLRGVEAAGEIIAADAGKDFNVASIIDGDTRAYPFRYIIETKGKKPLGVEEYPEAQNLYIVAKGNEDFVLRYPVWEIQSFLPARIEKSWEVQNGYRIFKLVKK
ncbi:MAG: glycosyltransferase family 39 protein [Patescibacteria group bacterium]|nr:glycosyltransferase family 39 protein [Patescibacteria group bacterium]